jgi:hypothetical protein
MHVPGQGLCLADHVRACRIVDQVVLLDMLHGRYVGVGGRAAVPLCDAVEGWPPGDAAGGPIAAGEASRVVQSLLAQGLLTRQIARRQSVVDIEPAARSFDAPEATACGRTGVSDLRRFLRAAAVARLWLRWRSMQAIADAVAARRQRPALADDALDPQRLQGPMAIYDRLRPLALTSRDQCLLDSLTLVNFLAAQRLFPRWVIGVKTNPFRAHSWVQCGDMVLNDQHENVRRFKPILVV